MQLTRKGEQEAIDKMLNNLHIIKDNKYLNKERKADILHTSFWNHLLRFIIIDGEEYPTNSMMMTHVDIGLRYTNPHEQDIRVSYDYKKKILFVEKMELVPHPFTYNQRVDGDMACLCGFFGYEIFGYTNPDRKVQEWNKIGEEIPIGKITSLKIESFWDKPKATWNDRDDYTAYKIFIKTKQGAKNEI